MQSGPPDNNSIRAGRRARSPTLHGGITTGQGYRSHDGTGGKQHNIRLSEILYFLHASVSAGAIPTYVNGPFRYPSCSEMGQQPHLAAASGQKQPFPPTNLALADTSAKLVNHDG